MPDSKSEFLIPNFDKDQSFYVDQKLQDDSNFTVNQEPILIDQNKEVDNKICSDFGRIGVDSAIDNSEKFCDLSRELYRKARRLSYFRAKKISELKQNKAA